MDKGMIMASVKELEPLGEWVYEKVCEQLVKRQQREDGHTITFDDIEQMVRKWVSVVPIVEPDLKPREGIFDERRFVSELADRIQKSEVYTKPVGFSYQDEMIQPWLRARKQEISWTNWNGYRKYLTGKQGWSSNVIRSMDEDTDKILDLMGDPQQDGPFDRRGLVVAPVQSGKTANYIAMMAKAADAGYHTIIVLAGIHNVLRNQTQIRIEEGFTGKDTSTQKWIGVGEFPGNDAKSHKKVPRPTAITTRFSDFNRISWNTLSGFHADSLPGACVLVVKKNPKILGDLLSWVEKGGLPDKPLLFIDDEADNASINIKYDKNEISRINSQIREILDHFSKKTYIGYTATPFANVLIDANARDEKYGADIFPKSFVYTLEESDAYFGPTEVFADIDDVQPRYVRRLSDGADLKLKSGDRLEELPEDLKEAIRTFIIACAIRVAANEQDNHMSMMVNLSPYQSVQKSTANLIKDYVERISNDIRAYSNFPSKEALSFSSILRDLHDTWDKEYNNNEEDSHTFEWSKVQQALEIVKEVRVAVINSKTTDSLDYDNGEWQRVIAVGGYRLSRGLTLEGLMVSYYARNARAYDTLMQMARWFGYRIGYKDLCRVWMSGLSADWYRSVGKASQKLTDEIREMSRSRATPKQYVLQIQNDIDALLITARDKRGAAEVSRKARLDGSFIETTAFDRDPEIRDKNERAAKEFLRELVGRKWLTDVVPSGDKGYFASQVPASQIKKFLSQYTNCDEESPKSSIRPLLEHIDLLSRHDHDEWDVYIHDNQQATDTWAFVDSYQVHREHRTRSEMYSTDDVLRVRNSMLSSPDVEKVSLTPEQIRIIENDYKEENPGKKRVPGKSYRLPSRHPLLVIHAVDMLPVSRGEQQADVSDSDFYIGWSISFPKYNIQESVSYVFNATVQTDEEEDDDEFDE